jgi:hypothetical protein
VAPLVESINTLGTYIFEIHKESCSVKEDDLSFSTFSFRKDIKTTDQAIELFLKSEKELEGIIKAGKGILMQKRTKPLNYKGNSCWRI